MPSPTVPYLDGPQILGHMPMQLLSDTNTLYSHQLIIISPTHIRSNHVKGTAWTALLNLAASHSFPGFRSMPRRMPLGFPGPDS